MIVGRSSSTNGIFRKGPFKVLVCLVTLWSFLFSTISYDLAWAARTTLELSADGSNRAGSPGVVKELNVDTFTLPEYLGRINDSWKGSADKMVIHIQDAHCNYYAQHKISEIIEYLNKQYGINTINLEGGTKDYDLSIFADIDNKVIRDKVSDYFVKEGLVNGAEYFAINNPEKTTLWGIEDTKLYMDNLNIYRDSLRHKDEVDKHLKALAYILSNLKTKIYSPELLDLDNKYSQYKAGNLPFKDYLANIIQTAKKNTIDIKSFKNIYLLNQALGEEANIDFKKANIQRDDLIDKLQKRLSKKHLEELVLKTVEFKTEKISQKDFYAYILDKAKRKEIVLNDFPELQKYISYVSMYDAIDKTKTMDELEKLEDGIKESLFKNDNQRELNRLSKNLAILKNIFNITLTKDDYQYYVANKEYFSAVNYSSFINKKAPFYKIAAQLDKNVTDLDRYREDVAKFYEYSFKRDNEFLKNIKFSQKHNAVVVTGGFHTENLCEIFKRKNISYVSIMPNFKNCEGYICPYFNVLSGKPSQFEKSVSTSLSLMQVASFLNELGIKANDPRRIELLRIRAIALQSMYQTQNPIGFKLTNGKYVIFDRNNDEPTCNVFDTKPDNAMILVENVMSGNANSIIHAFSEVGQDRIIRETKNRMYLHEDSPVITEAKRMLDSMPTTKERDVLKSTLNDLLNRKAYRDESGKAQSPDGYSAIQIVEGLLASHPGGQGIYIARTDEFGKPLTEREQALQLIHELVAGVYEGSKGKALDSHSLAQAVERSLRSDKTEDASVLLANAESYDEPIWEMSHGKKLEVGRDIAATEDLPAKKSKYDQIVDTIRDLKESSNHPQSILIVLKEPGAGWGDVGWGDIIIDYRIMVASLLKTWPQSIEEIVIVSNYPEVFMGIADSKIKNVNFSDVFNSIDRHEFDLVIDSSSIGSGEGFYLSKMRQIFTSRHTIDYRYFLGMLALSPHPTRSLIRKALSDLGLTVAERDDYTSRRKEDKNSNKIFVNFLAVTYKDLSQQLRQQWVQTIALLLNAGYDVVVNGGASNDIQSSHYVEGVVEEAKRMVSNAASIQIRQFEDRSSIIDYLKNVQYVVTIDTGVFWVAQEIVGIPSVVITGDRSYVTAKDEDGFCIIDNTQFSRSPKLVMEKLEKLSSTAKITDNIPSAEVVSMCSNIVDVIIGAKTGVSRREALIGLMFLASRGRRETTYVRQYLKSKLTAIPSIDSQALREGGAEFENAALLGNPLAINALKNTILSSKDSLTLNHAFPILRGSAVLGNNAVIIALQDIFSASPVLKTKKTVLKFLADLAYLGDHQAIEALMAIVADLLKQRQEIHVSAEYGEMRNTLNDILKTLDIKIVLTLKENACIVTAKGLIKAMGWDKKRVAIRCTQEISESMARERFPGYEIVDSSKPDDSNFVIEFCDLGDYDMFPTLYNIPHFPFKFDLSEQISEARVQKIREELNIGERPVIVLGSPADGELEKIIAVYDELYKDLSINQRPLIIIAPRKSMEKTQLASISPSLSGAVVTVRTNEDRQNGNPFPDMRGKQALLLNTIGELHTVYALGNACFVGRSHHIFEPASVGKPVLYFDGDWGAVNQMAKDSLVNAGGALVFNRKNLQLLINNTKQAKMIGEKGYGVIRELREKDIPDATNIATISMIANLLLTTEVSPIDVSLSPWPQAIKEDLLSVGPDKNIGYLPLDTIGPDSLVRQIISWAHKKGLTTAIILDGMSGRTLYVYDKVSLQKLINQHEGILIGAGIPLDADTFVNFIEHNYVSETSNYEAHRIIGLAFANPLFAKQERPISVDAINDMISLVRAKKIDRTGLIIVMKEKLNTLIGGDYSKGPSVIRSVLSATANLDRPVRNEIEMALRTAVALEGLSEITPVYLNVVAQVAPIGQRNGAASANRKVESKLVRNYNGVAAKSFVGEGIQENDLEGLSNLTTQVREALDSAQEPSTARALLLLPAYLQNIMFAASERAGIIHDGKIDPRIRIQFVDQGDMPDLVTQFELGIEVLEHIRNVEKDEKAEPSQRLLNLIAAMVDSDIDPRAILNELFKAILKIRRIDWRTVDEQRKAWEAVATAL